MNRGFYIVSLDGHQDTIWTSIIKALSHSGVYWSVDCLDCLYETALKCGHYTPDELLPALCGNVEIMSARMISIPAGQPLNRPLITSNDYLKSNCEGVVLCTDGLHFEIFFKNAMALLPLFDAFKSNDNVAEISWIDNSFGGREEFTV